MLQNKLAAFLLILCASVTPVFSVIFEVTNVSSSGSGSFADAVDQANVFPGDDEITFSPITDGFFINLSSGTVSITDNLSIIGNGASNTILLGDGSSHVLQIADGINITVSNAHITGGGLTGDGINFQDYANSASFSGLEISNCHYGIEYVGNNVSSSLTITNCHIHNNNERGVSIGQLVDLSVVNSSIVNNPFNEGLGVYGIIVGNILIVNSTFTGNERGLTINTPDPGKNHSITNNTIANNSDYGLWIIESYGNYTAMSLHNNIIFENGSYDIMVSCDFSGGTSASDIVSSQNIIGDCLSSCGCPTAFSTSNPNLDPSGLQENGGLTPTLALTPLSTNAINQANPSYAPTIDQRGFVRVGAPDIGAFEFSGSSSCNPTIPPADISSTVSATDVTLSWSPINSSVACEVIGGSLGSFTKSSKIFGSEPLEFTFPSSALTPGTYNWRVRCACSVSPTVQATPYSVIGAFAIVAPKHNSTSIASNLSESSKIIEIYSLSGVMITRFTTTSKNFNLALQVPDLASGVYLSVLRDGNRQEKNLLVVP